METRVWAVCDRARCSTAGGKHLPFLPLVRAPQIVGWEGVFGVIGTLGIMAPVAFFLPGVEGEGIHENIVDTATVRAHGRVWGGQP